MYKSLRNGFFVALLSLLFANVGWGQVPFYAESQYSQSKSRPEYAKFVVEGEIYENFVLGAVHFQYPNQPLHPHEIQFGARYNVASLFANPEILRVEPGFYINNITDSLTAEYYAMPTLVVFWAPNDLLEVSLATQYYKPFNEEIDATGNFIRGFDQFVIDRLNVSAAFHTSDIGFLRSAALLGTFYYYDILELPDGVDSDLTKAGAGLKVGLPGGLYASLTGDRVWEIDDSISGNTHWEATFTLQLLR